MTAPATSASDADIRVIEELLRTIAKAQRALQMYLPNNPVYQRALDQVADGFRPVWGVTGRLVLEIEEDRILWDEMPVYQQPAKAEGLAWQLYKDGLRRLTLLPGVESEEIIRFLQVVNRARMLPADAGDDMLTLLWEQEFVLISYVFVEVMGEGITYLQESPLREAPLVVGGARAEVASSASESEAQAVEPGGLRGVVDLTDFDATPYFLEDAEIRLIQNELDEEYRRDIREAAIDALLDVLESQRDSNVRREVVTLLDQILPAQLATGGFRAVARILRELRVIAARAPGLDRELHDAVLSFEERLSAPDVLEHLFRLLADTAGRPADEDIGEVLRELKPTALPAVLSQMGRIGDAGVRRVLESSVESLARSQPQAVAAVLQGDDTDAITPAIALAARLRLVQLIPTIVQFVRHDQEIIRAAAVRALGEFATPTAIAAVESALGDAERVVRQAALSVLVERGGSGGMVRRLETMLFDDKDIDYERSERRALFEAYGQFGGEATVPRLRELLEPRGLLRRVRSPELRACAIFALGKVRTFDARLIVDRFTADKEPVVRSAANSVLRDWNP